MPRKKLRSERSKSIVGFGHEWFVSRFGVRRDLEVAAESQTFALGDAIVLVLAPSPKDALRIDLERLAEPTAAWLPMFDPGTLAKWRGRIAAVTKFLRLGDGPGQNPDILKTVPVFLRPPLTDLPVVLIRTRLERNSVVRSFFDLVGGDATAAAQIAGHGIDYGAAAPERPGSLAVHMVVLTSEPDGSRMVVLAQRSGRPSGLGLFVGTWSASIEEQLAAHEGTIEEAARRGLKEELLGRHAKGAEITLQAIFVEKSLLNLVVGVVCVTPLSFNEVVSAWEGCVDRGENAQIVGLPARPELLSLCVRRRGLPAKVRAACVIHPDFEREWKNVPRTGWKLHPTSAFRLALALRAIEAEAMFSATKRSTPTPLSTTLRERNGTSFPWPETETSRYHGDSREVERRCFNSDANHLFGNEGHSNGPIEQKGGGTHIEQSTPPLVKSSGETVIHALRYELVFPILAVTPGLRATAFVCLSSRFSMPLARMLAPRRRRSEAVEALRAELEKVLADCAPSTIVVERGWKGPDQRPQRQLRRLVLRVAREAKVRIVEVTLADACIAISGTERVDAPATVLGQCYPSIAARLEPPGQGPFRSDGHRRELRPLIAAAALAHAVALEAIQAIPPEALHVPPRHRPNS